MTGLSPLEVRCVKPFYLKMMGCNVLNYSMPYGRLRELGQGVRDDDVVELLGGLWRPRVMGAWFAAGREERLAEELLRSLETSAGSLTAPPLATVALRGLGTAAAPALQTYLAVDLERQHGSARFIAAALKRLGSPPEHPAVDDTSCQTLSSMLAVADQLAAGPGTPQS